MMTRVEMKFFGGYAVFTAVCWCLGAVIAHFAFGCPLVLW